MLSAHTRSEFVRCSPREFGKFSRWLPPEGFTATYFQVHLSSLAEACDVCVTYECATVAPPVNRPV